MRPQQSVTGMVALGNGNVVVAGTVGSEGKVNGGHVAVAELLGNGRLDPGFGDRGVALSGIKLQPWQILAQPDGKVLILGPSRAPGTETPVVKQFPDWQVLRLLPDGSPDPSFGRKGFMVVSGVPVASEGPASTIAPELAANGDIILPTVIGRLFSPSMTSGLVRLNPDGSRDTSFGIAGVVQLPASLQALAVGSDGSTIAAISQRSGARLLSLTPSGGLDPGFNQGAPLQLPAYSVDSLLVEADGAIELHGSPSPNGLLDSRIWRYTRSGAPDASWGSAGAIDLGPSYGYINQLLPASDGGSLLVTMGVVTSIGSEPTRARILRLTPAGQIDQAPGGASGAFITLPFGGGAYRPGTIANLHQNSFTATGVIQRAGGTLIFNGRVEAAEELISEGGNEWVAGISGFALAALNPAYQLESTFTGTTKLRLAVRVTSTRLRSNGIAVRLRASHAALAVVTVTSAGKTIAKGTVPFFSIERTVGLQTTRIPLTGAGKRLLRQHKRRVTVTIEVSAADLAANHTTVRSSATLGGGHV